MTVDFNEVKINVRSLLTSTPKSLSIRQLLNDYYQQEGENIPYKNFGFNSVIELLQNMKDDLIVPPNPDYNSILSLVVNDKIDHLRKLVVKQKSNTKKKKRRPGLNNTTGSHANKSFYRNNCHRYSQQSPIVNNYKIQSSLSNNKEYSNFNNNLIKQNGFVTHELQSFLEEYISGNQKPLNLNKFVELVKNHQDYSVLNINCLEDLKDEMNSFLRINKEGITLKNITIQLNIETNGSNSLNNHSKDTTGLLNKIDVYSSQLRSSINYSHVDENISKTHGPEPEYENLKLIENITKQKKRSNNITEISYKNGSDLSSYENVIKHILSSNYKLKIALHVKQLLFSPPYNKQLLTKIKMMLVELHNPSSFYLQYDDKTVELNRLMEQMQHFYDKENENYFVKPEHVLPDSYYASSYTTYFSDVKQWLRVRILKEINFLTVKVIYVDYGTINDIPKTELRFLKKEFCFLPCQAIHCCLTGYNDLDIIAPEVTDAFWEIIDNKPVYIQIDKFCFFNDNSQILHVTLYQSNNSIKLKNINEILTIMHLNR